MTVTRLDPAQYITTPWRNGGGVTVDIAAITQNTKDFNFVEGAVAFAGLDGTSFSFGIKAEF